MKTINELNPAITEHGRSVIEDLAGRLRNAGLLINGVKTFAFEGKCWEIGLEFYRAPYTLEIRYLAEGKSVVFALTHSASPHPMLNSWKHKEIEGQLVDMVELSFGSTKNAEFQFVCLSEPDGMLVVEEFRATILFKKIFDASESSEGLNMIAYYAKRIMEECGKHAYGNGK